MSKTSTRQSLPQVHFDCYYGKIDVVSSRFSALLGKNEIVPEVCILVAVTVGQSNALPSLLRNERTS
jgi:hypothetical protein